MKTFEYEVGWGRGWKVEVMKVEETQEREERAGWSSRQDCCCRVQGTTGTFAPVSADYRVQLNVERESLFPAGRYSTVAPRRDRSSFHCLRLGYRRFLRGCRVDGWIIEAESPNIAFQAVFTE